MAFGIVLLVSWLVVLPGDAETAWELTHRISDSDPDFTVYTISRSDENGSAKISIERSETRSYDSEHFARVVLSFDKHLSGLLEEEHGRAKTDVLWRVDDSEQESVDGWWISGDVHFIVDGDQFETWRTASKLFLYTYSPVRKLDPSFNLDGLGTAFIQIASGVPTNMEGSRIPLAGIDGVSNPVLIESSKATPFYPERARNQKLSGQVILQVVVKADGSVGEMLVVRCNRPALGFEKATKDAVRQWRYEPATRDGQPLAVYFTVVVDYSLH